MLLARKLLGPGAEYLTPPDTYRLDGLSLLYNTNVGASISALCVSEDGAKAIGVGGLNIYEFSLSTPNDFRTTSLDDTHTFSSGDLSSATSIRGASKVDDGEILLCGANETFHRITLSADMTVASPTVTESVDLSADLPGNAWGVSWRRTDGLELLVSTYGGSANKVRGFDLSSAYTLTGATYATELTVAANTLGLATSADGTRLFAPSNTDDTVYEYSRTLATDDVSTFTSTGESIAPAGGQMRDCGFFDGGNKFFVHYGGTVYVYGY